MRSSETKEANNPTAQGTRAENYFRTSLQRVYPKPNVAEQDRSTRTAARRIEFDPSASLDPRFAAIAGSCSGR